MPIPTDIKLYNETKEKIMNIYKKSSAYSSGAIVKEYKKEFKKKYGLDKAPYINDNKEKSLKRWFKEDWINVNPKIGITNKNAYPLYRPTIKINENTPTIFQEIPLKRLLEQSKLKQEIKGIHNLPPFSLFY